MKLFESTPVIVSVTNNSITLEPTAYIGNQSSVRLTTLDIDGNVQTDEIIDVDVFEKRRRDEILRRRVRLRVDDVRPAPRDISDDTPTVDSDGSQRPSNPVNETNPANPWIPTPAPAQRKFKFAPEISKEVTVAQVGEELMDTDVYVHLYAKNRCCCS